MTDDLVTVGQSPYVTQLMTKLNTSPVVAGAACAAYSISSIAMVIANKTLVSFYGISLPVSLLLFQNAVAVVLLKVFQSFGVIELPDIEMSVAKKWFPVNFVFVSMLLTGFFR